MSSCILEPLLKLVVPNYVIGALIGKGGTVLKEMTSMYGGFLRLSSGGEFYPGTDERIVVITGDVNQVIDLNNHIMGKIADPGRDSTMKEVAIDEQRANMTKIILTDGAAGLLIGKGGLTIKAIQEESKAKVSVAMPDKVTVEGERMLTIRGSREERCLACKLVVKIVAEDPSNMANVKTKYYDPSSAMSLGMLSRHSSLSSRSFSDSRSRYSDDDRDRSSRGRSDRYPGRLKLPVKVTADVMVPVQFVGGVLGKHGNVIKDIVARSGGARLRFEDQKSDDSDSQRLTITGSFDQVQMAYALVNDRVNS